MIQIVIDPGETSSHGFFTELRKLSENLKKAFPGIRVESLANIERQLYNDYDSDSSLKSVLLKAMRVPVIENLVSRDTSLTLLVVFADKANDFDVQKFDSVTRLLYPGIKKMYTVSGFHIQKEIEDSIIWDYAALTVIFSISII
jgi:hypothetical protein